MYRLDPLTLFVSTSVAFGAVAVGMAFQYGTQRTYPGFRDWLAGFVAMALMVLALTALGDGRPNPYGALLVNTFAIAGFDRFYRGTARFAGEPAGLGRLDVAFYGTALAVYLWSLLVAPHAPRRMVVVLLCVSYAIGRAALLAGRLARGPYRASGLFLAASTLAMLLALLVHAGLVFERLNQQPQDLVRRTPLEMLVSLIGVAPTLLSALAFMNLNARRARLELEDALGRVRQLEGVIHLCMHCKKVRVDRDSWDRIEQYLMDHSQASFSHGICPDCYAREYGDAAEPEAPGSG